MNSLTFTDADLRAAAAEVREAMLRALAGPGECTHEFSEAFKEKMRPLFARAKRKQRNRGILRSIAAIFILLFISMTVWLSVDAEAREAVLNWVRQIYEDRAVYTFDTVAQPGELPDYEITWIPEGFELVEEYGDEVTKAFLYHNDNTVQDIVIEYHFVVNNTHTEAIFDDGTQVESVLIDDMEGDYYYDNEANGLIWTNKHNSIMFIISSQLEKEIIIHIAESIVKK
ncbi:MAG: DUF4367 domain-containing protein [Oscillospiraceae bacterium]|nr:DUF4367 domain-containing protein [Oscillospiraceae bacterium]